MHMKSTGIIRGVDKMGRVVIPKELRNKLGVKNAEDSFEIFTDDDQIILKKYQPTCIFCDNFANSIEYEGHCVCENCIKKLKSILDEQQIKEDIEGE
ncbi:MAG: AbrB/MazE/SpoVT family DNA-binding domain-containing protein [Clostridia bacterium]|nr:AbrB/MazE/SpoVT family DNA-binding domain-containing protein [Clostridia bacterium]